MTASAVSSIALFGRPESVWPVAALLSRNLPETVSLTVAEDKSDAPVAPAVTTKAATKFHSSLDIDAQQLVDKCGGRFGLGVDLLGWIGDGSRFFVASSGSLPKINGIALHHIMLRAAMMNNERDRLGYLFQPFRFAARTATEGKFSLASDDPQSPRRMLAPIVHLDANAYADFLKSRVAQNGLELCVGRPAEIKRSDDGSTIETVMLDTGEDISADMFIDVGGMLSEQFDRSARHDVDLSAFLPFDRMLCAEISDVARANIEARAVAGGLILDTPLAGHIVRQLLFDSDVLSETDALSRVGTDGAGFAFTPGYRSDAWTGNLARLGAASASLSPLFSADTMLLQEQAMQLVRCLPADGVMEIEASEFNRKHVSLAEQLRDFVILPFLFNRRDDAPWLSIGDVAAPETLRVRLEQFGSRGRLVTFDNEVIDEQAWIETMIGLGIIPDRYDPIADTIDMKRIVPVLRNIVDGFNRAIAEMPDAN